MPPTEPADAARAELAVGLGFRPGTSAERILAAVRSVLGAHPIGCIATVDRRAAEPGLQAAAAELGAPVLAFTAIELAEVQVPHRSAHATNALGIPGVAEAAALLAGAGNLVIPRQIAHGVVVAAASDRPRPS
ncbi:cobalamin biosynthesis protein [Nocardia cyriacigeorgica]|nr:cobalamin biosynthesis protein [Nocardia cyriacigeorgica]